jgi:hypothetical protein
MELKFTENSKSLISFFMNNKCLKPQNFNTKTKEIFKKFYFEIINAKNYIEYLNTNTNSIYKLTIKKINNNTKISKPITFTSSHGFPSNIIKYIDQQIKIELQYNINITELDRNIKIYFLLESEPEHVEKYNNYVENILLWLLFINNYASKNCAKELKIFIYMTNLQKNIPDSKIIKIGENHANTAFTKTCPKNSEIVIFRKEEWFKVLIHETFHNFGMDFSDMNNDICVSEILNIFPVNSEVNLYEAYAEFWAKIMNVAFCSYKHLPEKNNKDKTKFKEFLVNCYLFLNFENIFSCFQMIKVLDFMNLKYKQLYQKSEKNDLIRKKFYKEETNVLAYYIITFILINNFNLFIEWCSKNNNVNNLLQFNKSENNQKKFCDFIIKKYNSKFLLEDVKCMEDFFNKLKKYNETNDNNEINYYLTNLRMTVCELC